MPLSFRPTPRVSPPAEGTTSISRRSSRRAVRPADLCRRAPAFVLIALTILTACSTTPPARRDVVVGLVGEPRTVFDDDPSARFVAAAVTETLVRRDAHDQLVPRLAESVPTIENGGLRVVSDDPAEPQGHLVATFRIRDARWQDGEPITASDVRFAWQQDMTAPPGTNTRWMAERIAGVEVTSQRDLRV